MGIDRTTKAVIAIEHTRIEPRDLESEDRWNRFHEVAHELAKGVVPGVFLIGQAYPGQRFPTKERIPIEDVAQKIVVATAKHQWASLYETWEVSPTAGPHPKYWVRVMLLDTEGSEMWGLPPLGHRHPQEVLMRFQDAIEKKTSDLHTKTSHANEHILLIDVTAVHAAALGSYVAHLIDVMETLRFQSLPVPTAVYFRGKDATGEIEIRRIWPF